MHRPARFLRLSATLALAAFGCQKHAESEATGGSAGEATGGSAGSATGGSGGSATGGSGGSATGGSGGAPPVELVDVNLTTSVLLANNYGSQLNNLFGATFNAGSAMGRMRIFARFCADAACEQPLAVVPAQVQGADANGFYVFSTAANDGQGFAKAIVIPQAPLGASYLQIVGDTQFSENAGKGVCTSTADCPGDADVLQMEGYKLPNAEGSAGNPAPWARPITVAQAGQDLPISSIQYLGHLVFHGSELWTPAPADSGRLVAAMSNADDTFRNYVALMDLTDASATAGHPNAASYVLQRGGQDFPADLCGLVPGDMRCMPLRSRRRELQSLPWTRRTAPN